MQRNLDVVADKLRSATSFADVFGHLSASDTKGNERELRRQYAALARMVHPDHLPGFETKANSVTAELNLFYDRAKNAIATNTYAEHFSPAASAARGGSIGVVIKTARATYHFKETPFAAGDFSDVFLGSAEGGKAAMVKVARDPTKNQYLANEAAILTTADTDRHTDAIRPFLPKLLDSVTIVEPGNQQYLANVFTYRSGYVSVTDIRRVYPDGLPAAEAAWIWRRIIGQAIVARMLNSVHGAIVPDHVLVHPVSHDPLHIGWAHAVIRPHERNARLTTVIDRWRDWYPPEVFSRDVPSHQTDLYMAGKTMLYLLGGDVARNRFPNHTPEPLVRIIRRCLESDPSRRPDDGSALLRESTDAIRTLWGRTYRKLTLPAM